LFFNLKVELFKEGRKKDKETKVARDVGVELKKNGKRQNEGEKVINDEAKRCNVVPYGPVSSSRS